MIASATAVLKGLSLLLVVQGTAADGTAHDFDAQTWDNPTVEELNDCANLAADLMALGKWSRCEVVPSNVSVEDEHAGLSGVPRSMTEGQQTEPVASYKVGNVVFVL